MFKLIWKIFKVESSNGCQKWPKIKKIQSPNSNSIVNVTKNQKKFQSPKPQYMVKMSKNKKNFLSPDGSVCSKNDQK